MIHGTHKLLAKYQSQPTNLILTQTKKTGKTANVFITGLSTNFTLFASTF